MVRRQGSDSDPIDNVLSAVSETLDLARNDLATSGREGRENLSSSADRAAVRPEPSVIPPATTSNDVRRHAKSAKSDGVSAGNSVNTGKRASERAAEPSVSAKDRGDVKIQIGRQSESESMADTLQDLRRRTSASPYWFALLAACLWMVVWLAVAAEGFGIASLANLSRLSGPQWIELAGGAFIPALLFFVLAQLKQSERNVRKIATSLTKFAVQLGNPEWIPREQVATVGQAIRVELAALSDGVERTLGRAAEVESEVRFQVLALEKCYAQNADQMRAVVDDIRRERELALNAAEEATRLISEFQSEFPIRLEAASESLVTSIDSALERISGCFDDKIESLYRSGNTVLDTLDERAANLERELSQTNLQMGSAFEDSVRDFTAAVRKSSEEIRGHLSILSENTLEMFSNRIERASQYLANRALGFATPFGENPALLTDADASQGGLQIDNVSFDPVIAALINKLPEKTQNWGVEGRLAWLRMMAVALQISYGQAEELEVRIAGTSETSDDPRSRARTSGSLPKLVEAGTYRD